MREAETGDPCVRQVKDAMVAVQPLPSLPINRPVPTYTKDGLENNYTWEPMQVPRIPPRRKLFASEVCFQSAFSRQELSLVALHGGSRLYRVGSPRALYTRWRGATCASACGRGPSCRRAPRTSSWPP